MSTSKGRGQYRQGGFLPARPEPWDGYRVPAKVQLFWTSVIFSLIVIVCLLTQVSK